MTGLQDDGNHGTAVFDLEGCCFIPFCHCVIEYDRLVRRKRQGSGKGTVCIFVHEEEDLTIFDIMIITQRLPFRGDDHTVTSKSLQLCRKLFKGNTLNVLSC
jgi:hypothetical protein